MRPEVHYDHRRLLQRLAVRAHKHLGPSRLLDHRFVPTLPVLPVRVQAVPIPGKGERLSLFLVRSDVVMSPKLDQRGLKPIFRHPRFGE